MNFTKFLRTPCLTEHLRWLLLPGGSFFYSQYWQKTCNFVKFCNIKLFGKLVKINKEDIKLLSCLWCRKICGKFLKSVSELHQTKINEGVWCNIRKQKFSYIWNMRYSLRKSPYFSALRLNTKRYSVSPYSVQMRENVDQNNSKYGHFLRSDWLYIFTSFRNIFNVNA